MGGRARNADMDPQCIALLCTCAEKKMWDDMSIVINRLRMSEMRCVKITFYFRLAANFLCNLLLKRSCGRSYHISVDAVFP